MSSDRIFAVFLRYLLSYIRETGCIMSAILWPAFNVMLFGIITLSTAPAVTLHTESLSQACPRLVVGATLWQVIMRMYHDIAVKTLAEFQTGSIVSFFMTPLRRFEWVLGIVLQAFIAGFAGFLVCTTVTYVFFGYNILALGLLLFPSFAILALVGCSLGLFCVSLFFRFGVISMELIFLAGWLLIPFSGFYAPITVLPRSLQIIARALPLTHLIESLYAPTITTCLYHMGVGMALSLCMLFIVSLFLKSSMAIGFRRGFASLLG